MRGWSLSRESCSRIIFSRHGSQPSLTKHFRLLTIPYHRTGFSSAFGCRYRLRRVAPRIDVLLNFVYMSPVQQYMIPTHSCFLLMLGIHPQLLSAFVLSPKVPERRRPRSYHGSAASLRMESRSYDRDYFMGVRSDHSRLRVLSSSTAVGSGLSPRLESEKRYGYSDAKVKLNLERIRQVETRETKTIRVITSSALRGKLRLSGRDKRGRIFLPVDPEGGSLQTLHRLLRETFPLGNFPVALYVKKSLEDGTERSMVMSDGHLRSAIKWAEEKGLDLNVFIDVHPDYEEDQPPEWLVDVPDPCLAEEWEMLSFYRFVNIDQPEAFASMLQLAWAPLGVRGRVYVASEGVNAQMAIPSTSTERFGRAVEAIEKLAGVYLNKAERRWTAEEFRANPPFPALHVRARRQIVADGLQRSLEWSDESGKVGRGMTPEEWHDMLDSEEATILDCRNTYESNVGAFEKAVPLGTSFFRESWGELERLVGDADRDAPIMTYCTGGIRCVKIAAYLEQEMGFRNVTRLEGGIVSYSKFAKERGVKSKFKGVNYVFDKRMGDEVTEDIISSCHQCGQPCADHTNCANPCCHARLIQCQSCWAEYNACCSRGCQEQRSREDLRRALMQEEREAMGLPPRHIRENVGMTFQRRRSKGLVGEVKPETGRGEEGERDPMWLVWPFQDPTLNFMFDRAIEEFRDTRSEVAGEGIDDLSDASQMIGILARLGAGKRALAVGLGSSGAAGRASLRQLAAALGEGGQLVAVEASHEDAKAARGLSIVSGARGCRVSVVVCNEAAMLEHLDHIEGQGRSFEETGRKRSLSPEGLFDVIVLGGGSGTAATDSGSIRQTGQPEKLTHTPAERLDLVLDRRLIRRTGLVLCDPSALVEGEEAARSLIARAVEVKGAVEHSRLLGVGPKGGLHIFKWKSYSH